MTKSTYQVSVIKRVKELAQYISVGPEDEFIYKWTNGYEYLELVNTDKHGGQIYRGSYHPDVICETASGAETGICIWCGRTLM